MLFVHRMESHFDKCFLLEGMAISVKPELSFDYKLLREAYCRVKSGKVKQSSPGVDGQTFKWIKENGEEEFILLLQVNYAVKVIERRRSNEYSYPSPTVKISVR